MEQCVTIHRFNVIAGLWASLVGVGLLGGCASDLPRYPAMSDADALATIAARQASVVSISAECDLDLTDARGQRVSLDGVLVAEPPGKVRLRAWKFGQAVFDLTLIDGKGWMMVPDDVRGAGGPGSAVGAGATQRLDAQSIPARRVSEALQLLGPAYFRSAIPAGGDGAILLARGPALGQVDTVCEIERLTLTPRRFVVAGTGDIPASELLLDEYALVNNVPWPMRVRLVSPSGEVLMVVRELELNGEIPAGAFVPPKRAKALP